jgi:hypothetical protein
MLTKWARSKISIVTIAWTLRGRHKVEYEYESPDYSHNSHTKRPPEGDSSGVHHTLPSMESNYEGPKSDGSLAQVLKRPLGIAISTTIDCGFVGPFGVEYSTERHQ